MNPSKFIDAHTLNEAWSLACNSVYQHGASIVTDGNEQKELLNLVVYISNGFETEHEQYFNHFGRDAYDQVMRVYTKGGDKELKKDYWTRIYDNRGVNQVSKVIETLKTDPSTKSATIVLSDLVSEKLPCVMDVNFKVRGEKLEMTVVFKSSDIAKKFIPDIAVLTGIHEDISRKLHIARGSVAAFIMSAQIHGKDYKKVNKIIRSIDNITYYDAQAIIDNWNGDADEWDKKVKDPAHYVNIENGYGRFLDFTDKVCANHITKNQVVMDLGCGTGIIAEQLGKYSGNVYGIDIADKMVEVARRKKLKAEFLVGNCLDIPFANNTFDAIVSRGVLISHVEKGYDDKFILEAKRVLHPGGLFIFDFITQYNKNETKKLQKKAIFNRIQITRILNSEGFKVIDYNGTKSNRVNTIACIKE